jgi:hypothetical protein
MKKLTLTCNVTGKQVTYTSEAYIAKRLEQAGSLENLLNSYVSREGKAIKKGKPSSAPVEKTETVEEPSAPIEGYQSKTYEYKDGTNCTVVSPVVAANPF